MGVANLRICPDLSALPAAGFIIKRCFNAKIPPKPGAETLIIRVPVNKESAFYHTIVKLAFFIGSLAEKTFKIRV